MENVESEFGRSHEKTVKTLCRLTPSSCASARCVKMKSGKDIIVISSGNELVYIMGEQKIEQVINVHSPVIKILDNISVNGYIWVITKDGKIWAISDPPNKQHKQKAVSMETTEKIGTKPTDCNFEIFSDLLGNADLSENKTLTAPVRLTSSSSVMQCSQESIVHWEPGLLNVTIVPGHMITCSSTDRARISVYRRTDSCSDVTDDRLRISSDPLYRTILPDDVTAKDHHDSQKEVTVLLYVEPGAEMSSECASSAIDRRLFCALFRTQLRCNLPVVLLGRDSGLVSYIPIGITNRDRSVPLEVLYHLEQPVVAIFRAVFKQSDSNIDDSDSTKISNTLVLVGALGKVVFITLQDSNPLGPTDVHFREYHVPGPVVCSAMNRSGDILFYSTLQELYAVPLRYVQKSENNERSQNTSSLSLYLLPSSLSPIPFSIPKVSALAVKRSTTASGKTTDSLWCVKADGRVLLVEKALDQKEVAFARSSSKGAHVNNGEIKQYLAEIQEKANCVSRLALEIRELDDVIKKLNAATHILCEILREQERKRDSSSSNLPKSCTEARGIVFMVHVDYERQGRRSFPRVILRCRLENSTKFTLSQGWSMVVQVRTSQPWFNETCEAPLVVNHSVSLDSSSSHHVSIHLDPSLSYLSPIEISCYICFDMKEILPAVRKDFNALAEEGFAVLVQKKELNTLCFLRSVDSGGSVSLEGREGSVHHIHLLEETLRCLNAPLQTSTPSAEQTYKKHEWSTQSIHVSREAMGFIRKTVIERGMADNLDGPQSEQLAVLYFLLFDSRQNLRFDNSGASGSYVLARTPNEEEVKFQVVRSVQGSSAIIDGLEVCVHTSSEALRCAIHSSLLMVLEPVLRRNPEKSKGLPIGHVRKRLAKLKEVQASLDLLREPFLPAEAETQQDVRYKCTVEKLIEIYRELRKVPTLIP